MLALPKVQFKQDGQFAIGNLYERTGQLDKAQQQYEQFLADDPQHASAVEVRFRLAETLTQLAMDAESKRQTELAQQIYQQAEPVYQAVVDAQVEGLSGEAMFQQALVVSRQKEYARSADLYSRVAQMPGTAHAARALTYAGRDYFRSNQQPLAAETLTKATSLDSPYAAEAAHWLAKTHLHNNQFEKAFAVASQWIGKTDDDRLQVPLIMDAADAAYGIQARQKDSVALYLRVVNEFNKDPMAPTALYNAAYAAMEVGAFEQAIQLTQQFETEFPQHSFLADSLEVRGDTLLLVNDPGSGGNHISQTGCGLPGPFQAQHLGGASRSCQLPAGQPPTGH